LIYSRIAGTGRYLPERILTNADLEKMVETTDEWIRSRTGIERRHIAADDQATSDLALEAARKAMAAAGVEGKDIDLVIVGTTTPDLVFPNVATLLQERLGIRGCPAFSLETACSGFVYALGIADKFIRLGESRNALVIGAETLSRITDWTDRNTCVLFGDGAGAVILQPASEPGIISTHLHADGTYKDLLTCNAGVSRRQALLVDQKVKIMMKGNEVFKVAVTTLGNVVEETLEHNKLDRHAIDWLVPHQANMRIILATARRLDMPIEKVVVTVQDHGNTSAASIPLALDTAVRDGRIKRGDLMLLETFGGGFTWGAALIRY
jgi:3-oxoacyl-[acyl-carrier-protein] synthase-3